jgi:replicative DNA helicase
LATVSAEDFFDPVCQAAFRMMRDIHRRFGRIPPDQLGRWWRDYKPLDAHALAELFGPDARIQVAHAELHARDVAEAARKRRLTVALEDLSQRALSDDPGAIAHELRQLAEEDRSGNVEPIPDDFLDELDAEILNREKPVDWASPLSPFAQVSLQPGRVIVIAAPPGYGKTVATQQMVFDALAYYPELHCTTVQVEMQPKELTARHYARLSGVDATQIDRRTYCDEAGDRLRAVMKSARPVLKRMHYAPRPFRVDRTRAVARRTDSRIVVVDYVQRVPADAEGATDTRERINRTMDALREVANDDGCCVIVVCAVTRTKDSAGRSSYATDKLSLASLKESGELEYGADAVYLLVDDAEQPGLMRLACHKARGAKKEDIPLRFVSNVLRFENPNAWTEFETPTVGW